MRTDARERSKPAQRRGADRERHAVALDQGAENYRSHRLHSPQRSTT